MAGAQYKDPASERLGNGRTMADLMRRGPGGVRGVIVAKATPGGLPSNYNPHDRGSIEICIDPDGGNAKLTLDKVTGAAIEQALAIANQTVQGGDIEAIRERAAVAFEQLAKISNSAVKRVPIKEKMAQSLAANPPRTPTQEELDLLDELSQASEELQDDIDGHNPLIKQSAQPPIEKIDRGYSPMAAFGLKKSTIQPTSQPIVAKSTTSGPPQKLLYFEKEGIGTVPAFFHEVLVNVARTEPGNPEESGFIVLIYDVRFEQAAARWFPPANDPYQRPWAVQINDDNRLYLVHTTGFQYIYDSREYCVLLVEKALRAPEGDG
jgi:hypothetical protein